jgi:hypothetical protein
VIELDHRRAGIIFAAMLRLPLLILALALAGPRPTHAASWDASFNVAEGMAGTFELPFPVAFPGTVVVEARWSGPRPVFFGVDGPSKLSMARRSGPSPQRIEIEAEPAHAGAGVVWKLTVKALAARGAVDGRVTVTVPDDPVVVAMREAANRPPPPTPPPPPPWMVRTEAPRDATRSLVDAFRAVEAYRAIVVAPGGPVDACSWQQEFLRYAASARDRLASPGTPPDVPTLRFFSRLAAAVQAVEELRSSSDPVLAGPVPEDREHRRDWLIARAERVRPVERRLDELTELLRRGHAPALEDERWVPRFTACLTACERNFDERVRLGNEAIAPNRELAEAQWDRILAAAGILASFGPYLNEP